MLCAVLCITAGGDDEDSDEAMEDLEQEADDDADDAEAGSDGEDGSAAPGSKRKRGSSKVSDIWLQHPAYYCPSESMCAAATADYHSMAGMHCLVRRPAGFGRYHTVLCL
jgi:hypothetical protein